MRSVLSAIPCKKGDQILQATLNQIPEVLGSNWKSQRKLLRFSVRVHLSICIKISS